MKNNKKIMLLAGDGVGPEVVNETTRIIKWFEDNLNLSFDLDEGLVGGASYDKFGVPLTDETLADAMSADAILFGSVGGPKYDKVSFLVFHSYTCYDFSKAFYHLVISVSF